jgi:regulator of replication initiation timing
MIQEIERLRAENTRLQLELENAKKSNHKKSISTQVQEESVTSNLNSSSSQNQTRAQSLVDKDECQPLQTTSNMTQPQPVNKSFVAQM